MYNYINIYIYINTYLLNIEYYRTIGLVDGLYAGKKHAHASLWENQDVSGSQGSTDAFSFCRYFVSEASSTSWVLVPKAPAVDSRISRWALVERHTQKWQRHDETPCGTVSYDGDTEIKSLRSELNNLPDLALALSTHSCTVVSKKLRADFDDVNFSAPIKFQLSWFNPLAMLERVAALLPHQGVH